MFQIKDIFDEGMKLIGQCSEEKFYRWCGDAFSLINSKTDSEAMKSTLDICTVGCNCSGPCRTGCGSHCLSLPREVATVLAVNINGHPTLGFGALFGFHLNGPGNCGPGCEWSWMDMGSAWPTYRDLITPGKLVTYLQSPEDAGKKFIVYGFDSNGNQLKHQVGVEWRDGLLLPTIYGISVPEASAPLVARITGIYKEDTVAQVRLSTTDDSGDTGTTLGVYEGDENLPQYRRIKLNRAAKWVRVAFLRSDPVFKSKFDRVPLLSRRAFLMALQAIKHYSDLQIPDAHSYEADSARLEIEMQQKLDAPLFFPIQVIDRNNLRDNSDWQIS